MNENKNPAPHNFGGIDGRCFDCDVRPYSRAAAGGCVLPEPTFPTPTEDDFVAFLEMTYVDPTERNI